MFRLAILFSLVMGIGAVQEASAQEPTYIGVTKCKLCHRKQHQVWSESKHAKALDVLEPPEQKVFSDN